MQIIAKPIGYPILDLDFVKLRSFHKLPPRWGEIESYDDDDSTSTMSSEESLCPCPCHKICHKICQFIGEGCNESNLGKGQQCQLCQENVVQMELREQCCHQPRSLQPQLLPQQPKPQIERNRIGEHKQRYAPLIPKVLLKEKYDIHGQGLPTRSGSSSSASRGTFVPQRQYYHSMSRIPMSQDEWEVDSDDLSEDEWRDEFNAAVSGCRKQTNQHVNVTPQALTCTFKILDEFIPLAHC